MMTARLQRVGFVCGVVIGPIVLLALMLVPGQTSRGQGLPPTPAANELGWRTFITAAPQWRYDPASWVPLSDAVLSTSTADAQLILTFLGSGVSLHYATSSDGGTFSAQIDDQLPETLDTRSAGGAAGDAVWSKAVDPGVHTLTVTLHSGTLRLKSVAVQGDLLDAHPISPTQAAATRPPQAITPQPPVAIASPIPSGSGWTTYQDTDPRLVYGDGAWQTFPVARANGGTLTGTADAGASLVAYFEGSGIRVVFAKGPEGRAFAARIDDALRKTGDAYGRAYSYGHTLTIEGLEYGRHTLTLTDNDGAIWIEAVEVQGQLLTLPEYNLGGRSCSNFYLNQATNATVWPAPYTPADFVDTTFEIPLALLHSNQFDPDNDGANDTWLDALRYRGYGEGKSTAQWLLHVAVEGMLIAADPALAYPLSSGEIIDRTNNALAGGEFAMTRLARTLLMYNERACLSIESVGLGVILPSERDATLEENTIQSLSISVADVQNGDFETGTLAGWAVEAGSVTGVLSSLGPQGQYTPILAPEGQYMAFLSTEGTTTMPSGVPGLKGSIISQVLAVPSTGDVSLGFCFQYISNDSEEFEDFFMAQLINQDASAIYTLATADNAAGSPAGGNVPPPPPNIDPNVTLSPSSAPIFPSGVNILDSDLYNISSSWMTDQICASYVVPGELAGSTVTLRFIVADFDDTLYRSAVVIDAVEMSQEACVANFDNLPPLEQFNVFNQPTSDSQLIATVIEGINPAPNGVEILGIHPNSQGELWYYLGEYRVGLANGWTLAAMLPLILSNTSACNNLPLLTSNGELTPAPPPTDDLTDVCLFMPGVPVTLYTLEDIRDRTNGGELSTLEQLAADTPILVRALHLNRQYTRVLFNNADGETQPERWINLKEAGISDQSACITEQISFITEADLPACETGQLLNCYPGIPISPRIFNGEEAKILHEFGSTSGGCNNTDKTCWGNPDNPRTRPCPFWAESVAENCGIDLVIKSATAPQDVYSYKGGTILAYIESAITGEEIYTLQIADLDTDGTYQIRYNYTHVNVEELIETRNEYVATGIRIGSYGPYGAYGTIEHVDTAKVDVANETYAEPPWN